MIKSTISRISFLGLILIFPFINIQAAQIPVNSLMDSGAGSLREAVAMSSPGDTIVFGSITLGGAIMLTTGAVLIDKNLTIQGNGRENTMIQSNGAGRIFTISTGSIVSISGLSLMQGGGVDLGGGIFTEGVSLSLEDVLFQDNTANLSGGGLYIMGSEVTIVNCEFRANAGNGDGETEGGGGFTNDGGSVIVSSGSIITQNLAKGAAGSGGGILNINAGSLTVLNSEITENDCSRAGGGIEDNSGSTSMVILTNVIMDRNITGPFPGNGGGFHITGPGDAIITGGSVNNNLAARQGGGLWNGSGLMIVDNVTLNNNIANGPLPADGGGGIYNQAGIVNVINGTVISNNNANGAAGSGGGILNDEGSTLNVMNSEVINNFASRAGGGIEDVSGAGTMVTLTNIILNDNRTDGAPGNGGGFHITGPGDATIIGGEATNNYASKQGGGLWNGSGTMIVEGMLIEGNIAEGPLASDGGGGVYNQAGTLIVRANTIIRNNDANGTAGSGGGILNDAGSTLVVMDSEITGNFASRAGGGIEDVSGAGTMVTLTNIILNDNRTEGAPGNGGGFHITGPGDATIIGGEANNNFASKQGGGFWNGSGTMIVEGMTIEGNRVSGGALADGGGGIYNQAGTLIIREGTVIRNNIADGQLGSGGGILNDAGSTLTVEDSQISGNFASRAGGGIEDFSGGGPMMTLINVELTENRTESSPGNGGGLHITGPGDVTIIGGMATDNFASKQGGGLWNGSGIMIVENMLIDNNIASGPLATDGGGGIYNQAGTVIVRNNIITNNMADGTAGSGGGILNDVGATLIVENSEINFNTASRAGGGIEDNSGAETLVTIVNVDFIENYTGPTPGNGGGIHITGPGDMDIENSYFFGNIATQEGGGFWNGTGIMNVSGTTVSGNIAEGPQANDGGGGVFNNGGIINISRSTIADNAATGDNGGGGGIHNIPGATVNISFSTVSGNTAYNGGGVYDNGVGFNIVASTIAFNRAFNAGGGLFTDEMSGELTLRNTIIGSNDSPNGIDLNLTNGSLVSLGYNLISLDENGVFNAQASDIVGAIDDLKDPLLLPLADNGGRTLTHAMDCSSPAVDVGDPDLAGLDQAGMEIFGEGRDIGAFELQEEACDPNSVVYEHQSMIGLEIFPNPTGQPVVTLNLPQLSTPNVHLDIVDLSSGKTLEARVILSTETDLNVSKLAPGIYMIKIYSDEGSAAQKFIKL